MLVFIFKYKRSLTKYSITKLQQVNDHFLVKLLVSLAKAGTAVEPFPKKPSICNTDPITYQISYYMIEIVP